MSLWHHRGQSLLEILISLSIGVGLLLLGYGFCSNSEWQWLRVQQSLQAQADQLWCEELLQQAIEGAGLGMVSPVVKVAELSVENFVNDGAGRVKLSPGDAVRSYHADSAELKRWGLSNPGSGQRVEGSDVLVVESLAAENAVLQQAVTAGAQEWIVSPALLMAPGDVVVAGDGEHEIAERVVAVRRVGSMQRIRVATPVKISLAAGALVARLDWAAYYVGLTGRQTADGQALTGLYVQDIHGVRQELVPNIRSLQVSLSPAVSGSAAQIVRLQLALQQGGSTLKRWSVVTNIRLMP